MPSWPVSMVCASTSDRVHGWTSGLWVVSSHVSALNLTRMSATSVSCLLALQRINQCLHRRVQSSRCINAGPRCPSQIVPGYWISLEALRILRQSRPTAARSASGNRDKVGRPTIAEIKKRILGSRTTLRDSVQCFLAAWLGRWYWRARFDLAGSAGQAALFSSISATTQRPLSDGHISPRHQHGLHDWSCSARI